MHDTPRNSFSYRTGSQVCALVAVMLVAVGALLCSEAPPKKFLEEAAVQNSGRLHRKRPVRTAPLERRVSFHEACQQIRALIAERNKLQTTLGELFTLVIRQHPHGNLYIDSAIPVRWIASRLDTYDWEYNTNYCDLVTMPYEPLSWVYSLLIQRPLDHYYDAREAAVLSDVAEDDRLWLSMKMVELQDTLGSDAAVTATDMNAPAAKPMQPTQTVSSDKGRDMRRHVDIFPHGRH